jgi:type III secretion system YscQ/HrcQ family protein
LEFLSQYKSATDEAPQGSLPAGLFWKFPISIGFVDLTPNEMWQIGVGDILVTEDSAAALFPNHFGKGWVLTRDASNSRRFTVDKYFERSMSLEPTGETTISGSKPDIGSLPLRLHVIVGEREFTLAEVKTLAPGTIVELEATKSDPVHLMVNGKIIGDGELVDVEGKLAVKVLGWRST